MLSYPLSHFPLYEPQLPGERWIPSNIAEANPIDARTQRQREMEKGLGNGQAHTKHDENVVTLLNG